jgi:hypothetical protein
MSIFIVPQSMVATRRTAPKQQYNKMHNPSNYQRAIASTLITSKAIGQSNVEMRNQMKSIAPVIWLPTPA